jgi:hypothetical protein
MAQIAFAVPVMPGQEDLDRQTLEEMAGPRREEHEAAMREAGMRQHAVWHQETPEGTIAVVTVEADDPEAAIVQFGSSDEPFNRWFRDQMEQVHGIDISQSSPQVQKVLDAHL